MMRMRNNLAILIIALFALASCKGFHKAELVEVNELLPVAEDVVYVDAIGGEASLNFYATSKVQAHVLGDLGDWAEVTSPAEFDGDGTVSVSFEVVMLFALKFDSSKEVSTSTARIGNPTNIFSPR